MPKMVNEMFDSRNYKPECNYGEEIVSYIYDEMKDAEKSKFENHLVHCSNCADEIASFSSISFSVQEWRDVEFGNLETPKIEIPYQTEIVTLQSNEEKISWFDSIKAIFSFSPMFLKTASAFGVLALTMGLVWFFLANNSNQNNVAEKENSQPNIESTVVKEDKNVIVTDEKIENPIVEPQTDNEIVQQTPLPTQIKSAKSNANIKTISPSNKSSIKKQTLAKSNPKPKSKPINDGKTPKVIIEKQNNLELKQVPRLSDVAVENTEDDDFRLSDLFSDLDSDK